MKIPDGDHKMRSYQVVSIAPVNQDANMIDSTRAELDRLRAVALAAEERELDRCPCEPAD